MNETNTSPGDAPLYFVVGKESSAADVTRKTSKRSHDANHKPPDGCRGIYTNRLQQTADTKRNEFEAFPAGAAPVALQSRKNNAKSRLGTPVDSC